MTEPVRQAALGRMETEAARTVAEALTHARPHEANYSGDSERYTPPEHIDASRAVMGGIDVYSASSAAANAVVGAARFYSGHEDGLRQPWVGLCRLTRITRSRGAIGFVPSSCARIASGS